MPLTIKQGLRFNGSSDYIDVGTINNIINTFTIDFEIFPSVHSVVGVIVGSSNLSSNGIVGYETNGSVSFRIPNVDSNFITSGASTVPVNTWSRITLVYNGISRIFYINGTEVRRQSALSGAVNFGSVLIGTKNNTPKGNFFNGQLRDVRLFNQVLTPLQVNIATPSCRWKMDEGIGTIAKDTSGNGNHGTVAGASWAIKATKR